MIKKPEERREFLVIEEKPRVLLQILLKLQSNRYLANGKISQKVMSKEKA